MKQNIIFILFIFVGFACKKNNRTSPDAAGESFYFNAFFQQSEVWLYEENTHATLYLSLRKQESNEKINGKYLLKIVRSGIAPKFNDKMYYVTFKDGEADLKVNMADFYPYSTANQDGIFEFTLQLRKDNGTMEVNEQKVSMQVTRDALARLDYVQYFEEEPDVTEVYLRISPKINFAQDGKMMLAINNVLNKNLIFEKINDSTALLALTQTQWNDLSLQDWQIYYVDAMQKIPWSIKIKGYNITHKYSINRRCLHIENQGKLLALEPFQRAGKRYSEQGKVLEIGLAGHTVKELPDEIACFSYLKYLYLSVFEMQSLPEAFGDLSTLEYLDIFFPFDSQQAPFTLPRSFTKLKNLVFLNMRGRAIKALPEDFGNLTALKKLNVSNAKLETLPESIGELSHLELLNLNDNTLRNLPSSIVNLSNLIDLRLSNNNFQDIPKEICQLSALVRLHMASNRNIEEIPLCLTKLKQLNFFNMYNAGINELPKGFAPQMQSLTSLDLMGNKLSTLPDDFIDFPKIKTLSLFGNPFSEEDAEKYKNLVGNKFYISF